MYRFRHSILLSLTLLGACTAPRYEAVPYPALHGQFTYFQEKLDQYASFSIGSDDVVLLGDDLFDRGIWNLFYDSPRVKNRGVALEGTECTLYRVDSIAAHSPRALLVSTGLYDLKNGRSTQETADRILEIVDRSRHRSRGTKTYVVSLVADQALKKQSTDGVCYRDSVKAVNQNLKRRLKRRFIDITSELVDTSGYLSPYYSFDGVRINGAGYEVIARILSPYVGEKARNSIACDPLLKGHEGGSDRLQFYRSLYNEKYAGRSAHFRARLSIFNSIPDSRKAVIFLGNSLTNNCFWEEQGIGGKRQILNKGISGDEVMDLYLRLYDVIDEDPAQLFMMAGINDFINDREASAQETWNNYRAVLETLKKKLPRCRITVFSTLPLNPVSPYYEGRNQRVSTLNDSLSSHTAMGYEYVDLVPLLSDEAGDLDRRYTYDGIHLNQKGYDRWTGKIKTGFIRR